MIKATQNNDNSSSLQSKKPISVKPANQKVKEKALEAFLRAGRHGFYQIPAYKTFTVTCLHTYISNFEKKGLKFDRVRIKHLNLDGDYTPFMRYWLADESAYKLALSMVNEMRSKRGEEPLSDIPPYATFSKVA
jgi:hypothetical protein